MYSLNLIFTEEDKNRLLIFWGGQEGGIAFRISCSDSCYLSLKKLHCCNLFDARLRIRPFKGVAFVCHFLSCFCCCFMMGLWWIRLLFYFCCCHCPVPWKLPLSQTVWGFVHSYQHLVANQQPVQFCRQRHNLMAIVCPSEQLSCCS